jgi:hypothetical protein
MKIFVFVCQSLHSLASWKCIAYWCEKKVNRNGALMPMSYVCKQTNKPEISMNKNDSMHKIANIKYKAYMFS